MKNKKLKEFAYYNQKQYLCTAFRNLWQDLELVKLR